jgi:hypothetical protein
MTLIGRCLSPVWRRLDLLLAHSQHHHQSLQPVTSHGIPPQSFARRSGHTHTSQSLNLNLILCRVANLINSPFCLTASIFTAVALQLPLEHLKPFRTVIILRSQPWASFDLSGLQFRRRVPQHFQKDSMTEICPRKFHVKEIPRFTSFSVFSWQ